jgi:glycosyltransferase involved in cell wall biosynthesis
MGLGVPVAVTDDPALREVAVDAASYFPPRDPGSIAAAVIGLTADPDGARRRASDAAPAVRAMHDIVANTRRLETVYDEALAGRTAAR